IRLFRKVQGGTEHQIAELTTDWAGRFRYVDHPSALGFVHYLARFDGDAAYTGSSAPADVAVQQLGTRLTLRSSVQPTTFGDPVELTAHLNAFADARNRTVKVYGTPYSQPERLVGSGTVNSHGDLVLSVNPALNTTYRAEWAGDIRYVPAKSSDVE